MKALKKVMRDSNSYNKKTLNKKALSYFPTSNPIKCPIQKIQTDRMEWI